MMLIINTFKFDYNLKQDDFAKTLVKDYYFYKFGFSGFSSTKSLVTNMKMDFFKNRIKFTKGTDFDILHVDI